MTRWRKSSWLCLVALLLGLAQSAVAQDCRNEIDRRFNDKMLIINERIRRTQVLLKERLENPRTPDDIIRAVQQDLSRQRQTRDEISIEWILILRRHQQPPGCE